jgi:hypothetical protein
MRRDVHPMEEAQGFRAFLNLDEPKYSIEQIAARTGKNPAYIAARLKLTELAPVVVEAFYREEIGVGHALLLAKLQPDQQEQALAACFKEDWSAGGQKAKRILLPVRSLQFWIESNILLVLKLAPFDKRDAQLVPAAGSCVDCPMRTGHNKLLFSDLGKLDACTAPTCYQAKVDAHVAKTIAAKPKLVQISTSYGQQKEGSPTLPRNKYTEIRSEKPTTKQEGQEGYQACDQECEKSSLSSVSARGGEPVASHFFVPEKSRRENPLRFLPAPTSRLSSGLRLPAARQDDVPRLLRSSKLVLLPWVPDYKPVSRDSCRDHRTSLGARRVRNINSG